MLRKFYFFSLLLSGFIQCSYAAEIKGSLYDRSTKEQLVGAYVTISSIGKNFVTELDGSFYFKNLAPGSYPLNITYLGYDNLDTTIDIRTENETIRLDLYLKSSSKQLKEVEVKSKAYGGSDEFALRSEQKSISLVNIVSASAIQISPDITVASVMQRVSGVTMDKGTSGEARYAVIRGMEKKYNITLVNGVKIPSPNDKDRYVPMDIFPAELLERLEVYKTLMPSMEGDATGGTVNMVMKSAPEKFELEASTSAGYSDFFQNKDFQKFDHNVSLKSPSEITGPNIGATPSDFPYKNLMTTDVHSPVNSTASLTLGNRFFKHKLGVVLAGSYQNLNKGANSDVIVQNATVPPSGGPTQNNLQPFSDILVRHYSFKEERTGVETKIDYTINDKNSLDLFVVYAQLNEFRVRSTIDSQLGGYSLHNFVGPVGVSNEIQTRQTRQSIYNVTLQGNHEIVPSIKADWSLVASEATQKMPDIANFSTSQNAIPDIVNQTLNLSVPTVSSESREWEHNTDKDLSGYLNLHYFSNLIPGLSKIDVGGLYRHKDRDNYYNKYSLKAIPDSGSSDEIYRSLPASQFFFSTNAQYGNGSSNAGTYTFNENISAYYAQLHYDLGARIKIDGGVRVENTDQNYESSLPPSIEGKSASFSYTDILPSIQIKYELNANSAIRLDYFRSVVRPAFADLIPFLDNNADDIYPTLGNDSLLHTVIDNYDLRYELYQKGRDQFLVGLFYKNLIDPIENALLQQGHTPVVALTPINAAATARNAGIEVVYRKFFGDFGVSFNYTYTNSDIVSTQLRYWSDPSSGTHYTPESSHGPLQGQAANVGNIALMYESTRHKIKSQLAFVYTGERIYTISAYEGLDNWQKPVLTLDFSAQKQVGKRFTIYGKANNLLNTPYELMIKQPNTTYSGTSRLPFQESGNYAVVQKDIWYRTFLIGLRYKI